MDIDINSRAVFRINNQTNEQWGHLITEVIRHTRCRPDYQCVRKRGATRCEEIPPTPRGFWEKVFRWFSTRGDDEDISDRQIDSKETASFITYEQKERQEPRPRVSSSRATTDLSGFTKLPSFLRERIWLETVEPWTLSVRRFQIFDMPGTQTVIKWQDYHGRVSSSSGHSVPARHWCPKSRRSIRLGGRYKFRWCGDLKLYQICRESRQIASEWYGPPAPRSIPFSPIRDIVCVNAPIMGFGARYIEHPSWDPRSTRAVRSRTPSKMLIPRSLLNRCHQVVLDLTEIERMIESGKRADLWFSGRYHKENFLEYAQYVRNTFYHVRHLTFSFLPLDDCSMRLLRRDRGTTHFLDGNWGGYNPLQHHLYSAIRVALLEAFSGLTRKEGLNKVTRPDAPDRRVPFPNLRTLEIEWDQLLCPDHDGRMPGSCGKWITCTRRSLADHQRLEEVQNMVSRWPNWIRVDSGTVPKVREIAPVLETLDRLEFPTPSQGDVSREEDTINGAGESEKLALEPMDDDVPGRGVLDDDGMPEPPVCDGGSGEKFYVPTTYTVVEIL